MDFRSRLAEMLSDVAYRLNDGQEPVAAPGGVPAASPSQGQPPPAIPDYRFAAWQARIQQRATPMGSALAIAAAVILVMGLVKFWQLATRRPEETAQGQEQGVVKKFEDAYHLDSVKSELKGDSLSPSAPRMTTAPPAADSRPLIYFFPRGEPTRYVPAPPPPPRMTFRGERRRANTINDPLVDILRRYEPEIQPGDDSGSGTGSADDPLSGGPTWHDGVDRQK